MKTRARVMRVAVCVHQTPLVLCDECKGPQQDAQGKADHRKALAAAERRALDAMMDRWDHSLDPMPEFTPSMAEACAELAKLRGK